jgi:hypothetical protein
MRTKARGWMLAMLAIGTLAAFGCAQKKAEPEATPPAAQAMPDSEAAGPAETPAGSVTEIWTRITAEQAKLSAAIEQGQLKDVHPLASGIRDLVVALADKASASNPAVKSQLTETVTEVTALTVNLDQLADTGDVSATQAEYAKLDKTLQAFKAMTVGP